MIESGVAVLLGLCRRSPKEEKIDYDDEHEHEHDKRELGRN